MKLSPTNGINDVRIGDVFKAEKSYGNGVQRSERWKILRRMTRNYRHMAELEVSFVTGVSVVGNSVTVHTYTLKRTEKIPLNVLVLWARRGELDSRGPEDAVIFDCSTP